MIDGCTEEPNVTSRAVTATEQWRSAADQCASRQRRAGGRVWPEATAYKGVACGDMVSKNQPTPVGGGHHIPIRHPLVVCGDIVSLSHWGCVRFFEFSTKHAGFCAYLLRKTTCDQNRDQGGLIDPNGG